MFEFEKESKADLKHDLLVETAVIVLYAVIWIFLGFLALTGGRGLLDPLNLTRWSVFGMMLMPYVILLFVVKFSQFFGKLKFIYLPAHDPEKGAGSGISIFVNPFKLFIIFYFIFVTMAFFSSLIPQSALANFIYPLQSGIGVGTIMQDALPSSRLLFSVFGTLSEDFYLYLILGILVSIEFAIAKFIIKVKSLKPVFLIMFIPNVIIAVAGWIKIHALVTGGSQVNELSHMIFGFEMASITLATGSIIPASLLHFTNNLFLHLRVEYGTTMMPFIFGGMLLIGVFAIGLYILIKRRIKK